MPPYRDARERFMEKFTPDPATGCWNWTAGKSHGYGRFSLVSAGIKSIYAHRFSLMLLRGMELPESQEVDHVCGNKACVNPDHLELVTHQENIARAGHIRHPWLHADTPTCRHGHELTPENTRDNSRGGTCCRTCHSAQMKRSRQRFIAKHGRERVREYNRAYALRKEATALGLALDLSHE